MYDLTDDVINLMTDFQNLSAHEAYERYNKLSDEEQIMFDTWFNYIIDTFTKCGEIGIECARKMTIVRINMTLYEFNVFVDYAKTLLTNKLITIDQLEKICGIKSADELTKLCLASKANVEGR